MNDILTSSLTAIILMTLLLTPVGCYLLWKRMSFMADAMSHSSIFGVAIGLLLNISPFMTTITFLLLFVVLFKYFESKSFLPNDSILSILSYGGMSAGLLILSSHPSQHIQKILLGDLFAVEQHEIIFLFFLCVTLYIFLLFFHKTLIATTINKNLATIYTKNETVIEHIFMLQIAIIIGFCMQIAGALVVPALLIFPAIAVTKFSYNYKKMVLNACIFGLALAPIALYISFFNTIPSGPSVIFIYIIGALILNFVMRAKRYLA